MSEKMRRYVEAQFKAEMQNALGCNSAESDLDFLARDAVSVIDWNNSALMHKDMKWRANYYLRCKRIA